MTFTFAILLSLGNVICWLYVLMKIFQDRSVGFGILGLLFWPFAFIYGWVKAREFGIQRVMTIWTLLFIGAIVLGIWTKA